MIKGKAKLEFGTGDIKLTACLGNYIGALCMITQEPHEIGEEVPTGDTWSAEEAEVIMIFTKTESIDVVIKKLQEVKGYMNGEFLENGQTDCADKLDFDAFMKN